MSQVSGETIGDAYLNIFSLFIRSHNLYNKVGNVCGNGFLGNVLDERAKLHWQTFFALQMKFSALVEHVRSEEHTSELQSHSDLVCRLLLETTNHSKL